MSQWEPEVTLLRRVQGRSAPWRLQAQIRALGLRNRYTTQPVVRPGDPTVVSLTTIPSRIDKVHLTLESIARGSQLPGRLILWVDDPKLMATLPEPIQRLQSRGLEVLLSENYGPHTKYYPYIANFSPVGSLVTADDDQLYGRTWLQDLQLGSETYPRDIVAHRVHVKRYKSGGEALYPYQLWGPCLSTDVNPRNFATGVSGVLYPLPFQVFAREASVAFQEVCPKADDVWLHYLAVARSMGVRQLSNLPKSWLTLPETQEVNLAAGNGDGGENDLAIAATAEFLGVRP